MKKKWRVKSPEKAEFAELNTALHFIVQHLSIKQIIILTQLLFHYISI